MRRRIGRPDSVTIVGLTLTVLLCACSSSPADTAAPATDGSSPTSTPAPTAARTAAVTTAPPPTNAAAPAPTTAAPTTAAPTAAPAPTSAAPAAPAAPTIVDASFRGPTSCPADPSTEEPQQVFVSWVTSGADEVYVAIDDPDTPLDVGVPLALSGSLDFPNPCPGPPFTRTYYVVAVKGDQRDVRSQTFTFG